MDTGNKKDQREDYEHDEMTKFRDEKEREKKKHDRKDSKDWARPTSCRGMVQAGHNGDDCHW